MQDTQKPPALLSLKQWIQIVLFGGLLLYLGKVLFIPLLFGLLVALIMYPVCRKIEAKGIPRSLAIASVILIVIVLFSGLLWLLATELNIFLRDLPAVSERLTRMTPGLQQWIETSFGISKTDQATWLDKLTANLDTDISTFLRSAFSTTISTVFLLVMIPIYAALFLYRRETFVRYLEEVVGKRNHTQLHLVLEESVFSYFRFIKGTFYVYIIVGVLNSIGLVSLGIHHALLYGMITAFMTIIPYIGIIISAAIPVAVALVTKDSIWYPIGVVMVFVVVQYLEANVIYPRVVGEQLNLSTWATLVGMIAGTIVWGIAGMILIIPFLAILKIITDHIPEWKALNILLNRSEGKAPDKIIRPLASIKKVAH